MMAGGRGTWRVDDEEARQLELEVLALAQGLGARADGVARHVRGADLLRDAARLALLHARAPHVVQQLGLACIAAGTTYLLNAVPSHLRELLHTSWRHQVVPIIFKVRCARCQALRRAKSSCGRQKKGWRGEGCDGGNKQANAYDMLVTA